MIRRKMRGAQVCWECRETLLKDGKVFRCVSPWCGEYMERAMSLPQWRIIRKTFRELVRFWDGVDEDYARSWC